MAERNNSNLSDDCVRQPGMWPSSTHSFGYEEPKENDDSKKTADTASQEPTPTAGDDPLTQSKEHYQYSLGVQYNKLYPGHSSFQRSTNWANRLQQRRLTTARPKVRTNPTPRRGISGDLRIIPEEPRSNHGGDDNQTNDRPQQRRPTTSRRRVRTDRTPRRIVPTDSLTGAAGYHHQTRRSQNQSILLPNQSRRSALGQSGARAHVTSNHDDVHARVPNSSISSFTGDLRRDMERERMLRSATSGPAQPRKPADNLKRSQAGDRTKGTKRRRKRSPRRQHVAEPSSELADSYPLRRPPSQRPRPSVDLDIPVIQSFYDRIRERAERSDAHQAFQEQARRVYQERQRVAGTRFTVPAYRPVTQADGTVIQVPGIETREHQRQIWGVYYIPPKAVKFRDRVQPTRLIDPDEARKQGERPVLPILGPVLDQRYQRRPGEFTTPEGEVYYTSEPPVHDRERDTELLTHWCYKTMHAEQERPNLLPQTADGFTNLVITVHASSRANANFALLEQIRARNTAAAAQEYREVKEKKWELRKPQEEQKEDVAKRRRLRAAVRANELRQGTAGRTGRGRC